MIERITERYREQGLLLRVVMGAVSVLAAILVLYGLWSLSLAFVKPRTVEERTAFIQMVVGIVGGLTLIGGLLVNFWGQWKNQRIQNENQKATLAQLDLSREAQDENQKATLAQLDLTRQGQITERFTKAIEQLGDDKVEVRLGGIYTLKQIADQESGDQESSNEQSSDRRWQIMEILTAYVRGRAQYERNRRSPRRDEDIQAILNVIRDLTARYGTHRGNRYLNLGDADLLSLDLSGIHLQGANLRNTYLEESDLSGAHLEGADLSGAHLEGAWLIETHLEGANLHGAHLQGTHLLGAKLAGATIGAADLLGANFQMAEFEAELPAAGDQKPPEWWSMLPIYRREQLTSKAVDGLVKAELTEEMIEQINGDWSTNLPSDWSKPVWWSALPSTIPSLSGPLSAGDYHISLGNVRMSFSVDEGWYSDLVGFLPYSFSITRTESAIAGPIIAFFNVQSVIDPDTVSLMDSSEPDEEAAALTRATVAKPLDLVRWFSERFRDYLEVGELEKVQPLIGGASGTQFEAIVPPGKGMNIPNAFAPGIYIFPGGYPRTYPYFLAEGDKALIIVLDIADETMAIIATSPKSQFEEFRARTRSLLDTVAWLA